MDTTEFDALAERALIAHGRLVDMLLFAPLLCTVVGAFAIKVREGMPKADATAQLEGELLDLRATLPGCARELEALAAIARAH